MKKEIHPKYGEATITCACGEVIHTRSTKKEIKVGVCSKCHPFFTGTQKYVDTAGRVEKFLKKYAGIKPAKKKIRTRKGEATVPVAGDSAAPAGVAVEAKAASAPVEVAAEAPIKEETSAPVENAPETPAKEETPAPAETPAEEAPAKEETPSPTEASAEAPAKEDTPAPAETPAEEAPVKEEKAAPAETPVEEAPPTATEGHKS